MNKKTDVDQALINRFAQLTAAFFRDPLGRSFDADSDTMENLELVQLWLPRLTQYGAQHLEEPELVKRWVWLVFCEVEIDIQNLQH